MSAMWDNDEDTSQLIEDVLPDLIEASRNPQGPDHDALMQRITELEAALAAETKRADEEGPPVKTFTATGRTVRNMSRILNCICVTPSRATVSETP